MECLASNANDIIDMGFCSIIFGGDLSTGLSIGHTMQEYLVNFTEDLGITFVDYKLDYHSSKFIFRVESTGAASWIDHFAVSHSLYNDVVQVRIEDSGINLSDHCPVVLNLLIPMPSIPVTPKLAQQHQKPQLCFRWDKAWYLAVLLAELW